MANSFSTFGLMRASITVLDETGMHYMSELFDQEPIFCYIHHEYNKTTDTIDCRVEIPFNRITPIPLNGRNGLKIICYLMARDTPLSKDEKWIEFIRCNVKAKETNKSGFSTNGALYCVSDINNNPVEFKFTGIQYSKAESNVLKEFTFNIKRSLYNEQMVVFNAINTFMESSHHSFEIL